MSKQVIHIGLAVSTDGFLPGKSSIVNIAAYTPTHQFNCNVLPQYGYYKASKYWEKFPDVWNSFKVSPKGYNEAVQEFTKWIKNFHGNLIACASNVDFWHIFTSMMEVVGECPFGSVPVDVNSYLAGKEGLKAPKRFQGISNPLELAQARHQAVTGLIAQQIKKNAPAVGALNWNWEHAQNEAVRHAENILRNQMIPQRRPAR